MNNLDFKMSDESKDSALLLGMAEVWFKNREVSSLNLFYLNMLINDSKENYEPLTMSNYASYVRSCEFPDDDGYVYKPRNFDSLVSVNECDYGEYPANWESYEKALSMIKLNYIDVIDDGSIARNSIALSMVINDDDEYEVERLRDLVSACVVYLDIDMDFNIEKVREEISNWAIPNHITK